MYNTSSFKEARKIFKDIIQEFMIDYFGIYKNKIIPISLIDLIDEKENNLEEVPDNLYYIYDAFCVCSKAILEEDPKISKLIYSEYLSDLCNKAYVISSEDGTYEGYIKKEKEIISLYFYSDRNDIFYTNAVEMSDENFKYSFIIKDTITDLPDKLYGEYYNKRRFIGKYIGIDIKLRKVEE